MPLSIPPGFANWTLTMTNGVAGASSRNSISIGTDLVTLPLSQADVDRIANLLRDGLTPRYDPSWLLGPTTVRWNDGGIQHVAENTGTEAGTHAAAPYVPPGIALVISKHSGLLGRSHRGRLYMPGLDEGTVDEGGIVNGAEVNNWQATIDALQVALEADAAVSKLVIFHDQASPFAAVPDTIVHFVVKNVVGSMRPRQRR